MANFLTQEQLDRFEKGGYIVLDGLLDAAETAAFKDGVDDLLTRQKAGEFSGWPPTQFAFEVPGIAPIVVHDKVMAAMRQLLGPGFYFHHIHSAKHIAGTPPANWHQDYEQHPQSNRLHRMCHVFFYLNGLNGEVGDLMFVPGSQNSVIDRGAIQQFGTESLPGTMVVDNLSPGSAVIVHSALWHARRAKPGGENSPRYFIDTSYCQAGVRWPGYSNYETMCRRAFETGLVTDEKYGHLFHAENYFDASAGHTLTAEIPGSLILHAKEWSE